MNNEIDISLLEKYLSGEIEAQDVLDTKGKPVSPEQLKRELTLYQEAALHIEGAALKDDLKKLHQSLYNGEQQRTGSFGVWKIAATILLIGVVVSIAWFQLKKSYDFEDYFDHFDQLVISRNSDSTNYSVGLEAYSMKDYSKAYDLLDSVKDLDDEILFYKGVSALGSLRFLTAKEIFLSLSINTGKYYQQIRWYLALSYWQLKEIDNAIELLEQIEEGQFKYKESAELLNHLMD